MQEEVKIVEIKDAEKKSCYTREILETLTEWFGNKVALEEYVEQVQKYPYWAAFKEDRQCVGFFSIKMHYKQTGEIFVCGVLPEYQHKGIGKAIYKKIERVFRSERCKYIVVKTLSDTVNYEPYDRTRKFYKSVGFSSLITLTEMWDEENPCLIMLKALE